MRKKWMAGVVVVALGTAGVVVPAGAATGGIAWSACSPGKVEQCGKLPVPLDWAKPAGAKTEVYVVRVPAKDQAHKLGSLVFNPGGPGGAGGAIFEAGFADKLFPQLRDRYDLVSFDPRGTGSSSQLNCGPVLRPGVPVFPKSQAEYDAMVASSRATGRAVPQATR